MRARLPLGAFLWFSLVSSSPAQVPFPGREIEKPRSEVLDSFLGYFIGIVDSDVVGFADSAFLHTLMPEFDSFLSLPFEEIRAVSREKEAGGALVTLQFRSPVRLPIPFRVLWDTPGTIAATPRVAFRERRLGRVALRERGGEGVALDPVYLFDVVEGTFSIDFDPWIDVLLGRAVDDVAVTRAVLFGLEGTWYAALMGTGYDGQLVVGYFDFRENRILIPVPRLMRGVGPRFFDGVTTGSAGGLER